ncbi:CDP-glycerol glycerophosphotransferase family protein [Pseudarthrobacter enclensis]|uniref:CDP-glycerol glycerophosphotransferase family protein n=1 Tax=Pseudarthrobacter enclensis TaxID=993070 RepID=UPI003437918E
MIGWQFGYLGGREFEKRGNWKMAATVYRRLWAQGRSDNPKIAFRLGHAYFRLNDYESARKYVTAAVALDPNVASWHYRLGFIDERGKLWAEALDSYTQAINLDPQRAEWFYRKAQCEQALGDKVAAEESLRTAVRLEPGNAKFHKALGKQLGQGAARWQEVEALEGGLALHHDDADWLARLAGAYYEMERFPEAAKLYERALQLRPKDARLLFSAGLAHVGANAPAAAKEWFSRAVAADGDLGAARFGLGVFYEERGDWESAVNAYQEQLKDKPLDAELHYRTGFANDRCYRWPEAVYSYEAAVALQRDQAYWHYRLGFVHERLQHLPDAAASYREAIRVSECVKPYWLFRRAYVLHEMGRYEEAVESYVAAARLAPVDQVFDGSDEKITSGVHARLLALVGQLAESVKNKLDAKSYFDVGTDAERVGDWAAAAALYSEAVLRSNDHIPAWYNRLGHALARSGDAKKACDAFRRSRIFARPYGVNEQGYSRSAAVKMVIRYVEYYESFAIDKNTILYESNLGTSIDCNPLAIYEKLVDDPKFSRFTHIWTVADNGVQLPVSLLGRENVRIVAKQSDLYLRYLATAGYLINNSTFPSYFIRKDGQAYLNTWHGTPLKKMGTDVEGAALEHANVTRNLLQATHLLSPNQHTTDVLTRAFGVDQLFSGRVAVTGYPRIDKTLNSSLAQRRDVFNELGIDPDNHKPIVLYAPTWRGSMDAKVLDAEAMSRDIQAMAVPKDFHLLVRAHHYTEDLLVGGKQPVAVVPRTLTTNDLLTVVDVLITDYSSVMIDFIATGRPVVLYVPDQEEYAAERGLYFGMDSLPGVVCTTVEEVLAAVRSELTSEQRHPQYTASQARFTPMEDGNATERAVAFFLANDAQHDVALPKKQSSLLFRHGMNANGMTTSLLNLTQALDADRHALTLLVDAAGIASEPRRFASFKSLPDSVRKVGRVGRHSASVEERWMIATFNRLHCFSTEEQKQIYFRAFQREYRRLFGITAFDTLVEFDGYSPFMASILLGGRTADNQSEIFLHNDMRAENQSKYPYLREMFALYGEFDGVISVSKALCEVNSSKLSKDFNIPLEKFDFTPNVIIPSKILSKASEPIDTDLIDWMSGPGKVFTISGRLSPEKDHAKLLRAFKQVVQEAPESRLVLIGDGVLAGELRRLTHDLGLETCVYFAGMQDNPFAILRKSDCFVLSSNHEGQPMVLLEAMVMGMPIVATDIEGNRGVLAGPDGDHGLLVPNSVGGLVAGMQAYLAGDVQPATFDADKYLANAIAKFERIIDSEGALTQ